MTTTDHLPHESTHRPDRAPTSLGRPALLGLALFLASTATFSPENAPEAGTASAAEIRRYAVDNADTLWLNLIAGLLSLGLLVYFVVELARLVREARRDSVGATVMTVLVGAIAANALLVTSVASIFGRPAELSAVSDRTVLTLYDVSAVTDWLYSLVIVGPCTLLVATTSWLVLRHRLMARWVAWAGFVMVAAGAVSAVSLVLPASEFDPFVIALFGWWLWPLAVSGALAARWWRSR